MPQPDYQTLIDSPTWDFIRQTADFYPPDAVGLSIAAQRAVYDRMCCAFHRGIPAGVAVSDHAMSGVLVRRYEPANPAATLLYFHGGGFVVGGLDSHDDVCAEICAATGLRVISVDYRLAPEHPHPAAFDDCLAATRAAAVAFPGPLLLAGDSAGGALAASVAHACRNGPQITGQVLIYPGLGGNRDRGSYLTHADAPMLTREDVLYYAAIRHAGQEPKADPTAAVLQDTDFTGLPPTVIFSAECDPLADDGRDYRDVLLAAGGWAEWHLEPGLVHGYLRARTTVPRAAASFGRICAAISQLAGR
ncbi:alpha/beta hydrolase [Rhodobacter ferrooxidans]|uniref:Alpha/beta hydrolase fold-3 domain protein n=1 Tax=Rhodobacter ferrooxidans TaxID=371731 RepID=C8RYC2_9RHOB|nr:alpha/beta hydrolase [Rhodobacter sp. SW2]EEW26110.1 Alpha/beta hydrolase fold-3 domain protein [Rhodobacter sp. SW2]